jgi:polysaccharide biosynthesis transport protein
MSMIERIPPSLLNSRAIDWDQTSDVWFLTPSEILRVLRRRWRVVLGPLAACLLAAGAWVALVPPQYTATVSILVDPRNLQVVKDGLAPIDQASDASLLLVDSQMRVLTSDDVYRQVVAKFDLAHDPEFVGSASVLDGLRAGIMKLFGQPAPAPDLALTALRDLRARTLAKRMERSFVVELGVTSQNREKAAQLVQAIAETYLTEESEARAALTGKAGEALANRLGELQQAVALAEERAQTYRATHNIVGTRAQLVSEQQLTQLNDQLGAARARVAELRSRLRRVELLGQGNVTFDAVTEIVQSATVIQLRTQIAQLETSNADALQNLGALHPTVKTNAAQLRSLRAQLDAEIKRIAASIANEYKAALANEASLAATLDRSKKEAFGVGSSLVRLRELERQVEASRTIYGAFLVRSRELQEQQRIDTSSSRIISPALPPDRRIGPSSSLVMAAALFAGLGLGIGGALLAEAMSDRIGSRRRLESVTKRPVLEALPQPVPRLQSAVSAWQAKADYAVAVTRLGGKLQREVVGIQPSVVLVTSADDRTGKSTLVHGLAASATHDGQRILVVDADPEAILTRRLSARPVPSLADVLRRQAPPLEAVVETHSGISMLSVDEPAMRFGTGALATAILQLTTKFDTILVDLGLVGTDVFTELLAIDPRFPIVVLTVSAETSAVVPVRRALDALGQDSRLRLVLTDTGTAA